jgi:hypothetical protein
MTQFYDILDTLKNELRSSPSVNTVSFGDITDIDLDKTSMFPLSHIIMPNVQYRGNILVFDVNIFFADIVDYNKVTSSFDDFYGSDNLHDIFNTQLQVVNTLVSDLKRGNLFASKYQLEGEPTISPFKEKFSNELAGWDVSFSVAMPNTISITDCSASDAPSGGGGVDDGGGDDGVDDGGGDVDGGDAPVILNSKGNSSAVPTNYIQLNAAYSFQILASNSPTSYSVPNLISGLSVDASTGIISGEVVGAVRTEIMFLNAANASGNGAETIYFKLVNEDTSVLLAPQNVQATDINSHDFLFGWEAPLYSGGLSSLELYKDNVLKATINQTSGSVRVALLSNNHTYEFKARFINSLGEFSPFSETISVTTLM